MHYKTRQTEADRKHTEKKYMHYGVKNINLKTGYTTRECKPTYKRETAHEAQPRSNSYITVVYCLLQSNQ